MAATKTTTSSPAKTTIAVPTKGSIVTDTQGRKGVAMFNPNTGAALSDPVKSSSTPTKSYAVITPTAAKEKVATIKNTPTPGYNSSGSVVDLLNSKGQASDYSSRSNLATQYGISNYTGTSAQNTQLINLINQGDPKTQMGKEGTPSKVDGSTNLEVTPETKTKTTLDRYGEDMGELDSGTQNAYDKYIRAKRDILSGGAYTPEEEAYLESIQRSYERMIDSQKVANKSTEGIAAEFGNRLGLNVGAPIQARGYIDLAITQGTNKIMDIQDRENAALLDAKQKLQDNKLKSAKDSYDEYKGLNKEKKATLKEVYDQMYSAEKDLRDYNQKVKEFEADQAYKYATLAETRRSNQSKEGVSPTSSSALSSIYKDADLTDPDVIKDLPVSDLTKAIMSGTAKVKDLTPTDKAKVVTEMYKVGFNPNQYVASKLENLVTLWENIPDEYKGIVNSFITPFATNISPEVAEFESAKKVLTREIARLNDVGMLSDQDVQDYKVSMASRADQSVDVVRAKTKGLTAAVTGKKSDQYADYRGQLEKGEILVKNKKTGDIEAIKEAEYDNKNYTKL